MFDGSDLSLAYGSYEQPQQAPPPPPPPPQPQVYSQQPPPPATTVPPPPQDSMYFQQPSAAAPLPPQQYTETYFDRLMSKRYDVLKVVSFALIIVFAISIDRFTTFYITQYIGTAVLTATQEMLVRVSYPLIILAIIWLVKTI